jgi:hypothetical protein
MPPQAVAGLTRDATVAFLDADAPSAVLDSDITSLPANIDAGGSPVLLLRDRATGIVKGFHRQTAGDLTPVFRAKHFAKFPQACMTDSDSASAWTNDGAAINGPLKGQRLAAADVDDGVYYTVLRAWYPNIALLKPKAQNP